MDTNYIPPNILRELPFKSRCPASDADDLNIFEEDFWNMETGSYATKPKRSDTKFWKNWDTETC